MSDDIAAWVTVTDPAEAATAQAAGADALVAQGTEAGGHRAYFSDDGAHEEYGLLVLLRLLRPPDRAAADRHRRSHGRRGHRRRAGRRRERRCSWAAR